jgi:dipeptidase E
MRLYLSSFRLGDHPEELSRLVGEKKRAAVVVNAADGYDDADRDANLGRAFDLLRALGLQPFELDLRNYFDLRDGGQAVLSRLNGTGLLWVTGGNAFVLRKAAAASGFDRAVSELLGRDELVYGGYSAGACLLTPTLEGIELCDDPNDTPDGYEGLPHEVEGLGLLPFAVAPHFRSPEHPETAVIDEVVEWFLNQRIPFVALRDGDVIVQEGTAVRVLTGIGPSPHPNATRG